MPRPAIAPLVLAGLALASCSQGPGPEDTDSPATGSSGGPAGTGSTGAASTGDAAGSSSGGSSGGATFHPDDPPTECGLLATCGVQCVDLQTDPANCGKCGVTCVIPQADAACNAGQCAIGLCADGWFDCDLDLFNGCEQALAPGQMCGLVCKPDKPEACNLFDDNCDGQCDEGPLPGCRQPVHRASSPTLGHFYTTDANEAMSGDFKPEALGFFHLYAAAGPGLVPFYRCLKGDGRRFYTTSGTCENAGPVEGVLGHIGTDPGCGSVPLYRLYGGGDHFYTTSEAERDNAVAMYGYTFEFVAGHVWTGP